MPLGPPHSSQRSMLMPTQPEESSPVRSINLVILASAGIALGALGALVATGMLTPYLPQFGSSEPSTPEKTQDAPAAKPANLPSEDPAYAAFDQGKYLTALELAEKAARRDDPQAHTLIGRIYADGLGVPKDEGAAARWYARAAELGDIAGTLALGTMLAEGRGVAKDMDLAAEMFEKAAATGDPVANYNLGLMFLRGTGKPENAYRAAQHIRYAAEKGVASAQYDLAALYLEGNGVPNDALEAAKWSARAAEAGLPAAQYDYAVLLLQGRGLKADESKAVSYLQSAANHGVAGAQNRLAHLYVEGVGVEANPFEAAKWRFIAKAGGITDDKLDLFVAALPDADRTKAEAAATEWRERRQVMAMP